MEKTRRIIKLRIFLWLILAGFTGWLLYMAIVPGGKITYIYDFKNSGYQMADRNKFIGKLTPAERLELVADGSQKIIGDPVYFSLRAPRKFSQAKLTLKYKNESERPLVEAGVLVDKVIWRYRLQPIENRIIEQLSSIWNVIQEDGTMLLQREKKYGKIEDFLGSLPPAEEIALYNYDLKKNYLLPDYQPAKEKREIHFALRGSYQFYTYIKDEDLDFDFILLDLNENKDSDPVDIDLYYEDKLVDSRRLADDGIRIDSGEAGEARTLNLKTANLPEGVYKIELRANDDIVTEKIITNQSKIAFLNKIWLADESKKDFSIFTDGQLINAQTINPVSLQMIKIGDEELAIDQTYKQFSRQVDNGSREIKISQGDIILSGNGVFSFSPENLINPNFKKVDENFSLKAEGTNYILANYIIPKERDGWKISTAKFDLDNAYREWNKNGFIISVPGLKADDDTDNYVEIAEIKLELEGKTFLKKLEEFLRLKI